MAHSLGLGDKDLDEGRNVMHSISVLPESLLLADNGVSAMHDVTRGGLLETLLEIAHLSGVGMEIDESRLPVPPVVTRFAQAFQFDPLGMISSGTLAVTVPDKRLTLVEKVLCEAAIPFAVVGQVKAGHGVSIIRGGKTIHYSEIKPDEDELARLWRAYPRAP